MNLFRIPYHIRCRGKLYTAIKSKSRKRTSPATSNERNMGSALAMLIASQTLIMVTECRFIEQQSYSRKLLHSKRKCERNKCVLLSLLLYVPEMASNLSDSYRTLSAGRHREKLKLVGHIMNKKFVSHSSYS